MRYGLKEWDEWLKCLSICPRVHQEVVEESFLPTLRTLMNAPATSPLAEVDVNNVVELFVELTRPGLLIKPSANTEVRERHAYQRDVPHL